MHCGKRESESGEGPGPPCKVFKSSNDLNSWDGVQNKIEACMELRCLCSLKLEDIIHHLQPLINNSCSTEQNLLLVNFLEWAASSLHDDLASGFVCGSTQLLVHHVLQSTVYLDKLLQNTKVDDPYLQYCSSQAISSLLPLSYCGQEQVLPAAETFLQNVINQLELCPTTTNSLPSSITNLHSSHQKTTTHLPGLGLPGDQEMAASVGLELDMMLGSSLNNFQPNRFQDSTEDNKISSQKLENQIWLVRILHDFVSHASKQKDEQLPERDINESCSVSELEDEMLCQEIQIKCALIKLLEPVWQKFTMTLSNTVGELDESFKVSTASHPHTIESEAGSSRTRQTCSLNKILYTTEGFKLWRALISVRANLNFVDSRNFSANLSLPVHQLQRSTPVVVWNAVLDSLSECLCYGSTLGLQSIPPEEPCQLAHTLIRLVRFDGFLSRVPYSNESKGFGGFCQHPNDKESSKPGDKSVTIDLKNGPDDDFEDDYNKAIVQKIIVLVLKSVALTTREARVDSSSGESDSSLSSHESGSSCSSDLVIIERNMNGVYKQLDKWIKTVLPVLPDTSLQDNILNLLQEQDDVLIEGLLCLLDTYIALQHPSRDITQVLPDSCPTRGFIKFLNLVGSDSSVLLDFLVSNETCFLLYLLRYLKFILKDWSNFVLACGTDYDSTISVILNLKSSIQRLLTKDLFPYNISPVYKLLGRIQILSQHNKNQ